MRINQETMDFVQQHIQSDTTRLLLQASRYPEIDMPFAVEQILARRQIKEKLPAWYANKGLVFPSKIAAEQCSSELTGLYKQRLVKESDHLCDLTGGLGIDSYFYSLKTRKVTYIERFESYVEAARSNFAHLGAENITVMNGQGEDLAKEIKDVDVFYLDPARRGDGNKRVFALTDCEPDLTVLRSVLLNLAPVIIAKLSPMADISHTLALLPETVRVHVVSVKNECKELLFVLDRTPIDPSSVSITCVNLLSADQSQEFTFTLDEERNVQPVYAHEAGQFLYEPHASILKAGAYKMISSRYEVKKLHVNSHLYTSDTLRTDFPGRLFEIDEVIPFTSAVSKKIAKNIPQANITVRNFPLTVDALRSKTKIKEGGDTYLFATTLASGDKVLIRGRKVSLPTPE